MYDALIDQKKQNLNMPSQLRVRFTSQNIVLDITVAHANDQASATLVREISLGLVIQAICAIVLAHGTTAGTYCMLHWKKRTIKLNVRQELKTLAATRNIAMMSNNKGELQ